MAIVVPFIGAAIGSAVGGTFLGVGMASWGWLGGSLLSSLIFKPPNQQGPRLQDLTITGTDYGQTIPWVAGSPRLAPTYVWVSKLREIANTQKVGKGGGQKVTNYTYECDVMLRLTENITEGVARDWINSELVRNGLTLKAGLWSGITVYTGEIDQLPDPTYEAAVGAGNAPAYRGGTTIVIRGLQLGGGKQLPNLEHQPSVATGIIELSDFEDGAQVTNSAPGFISASPAHASGPDTFLMSIGRWANDYATTQTDVWEYTVSTDTWSLVNTFNVVQALENCSGGNADSPYRVAIGSNSTTGRIYVLPSGERRYITRGSETGSVSSSSVVYVIDGGSIWYGVSSTNPRIYKNAISSTDSLNPSPIDATSSPISGVLNGMAIRGDFLYLATRGGGNILVYNKNTLAFVKTIATGYEGGGMLIGKSGDRIVAVCRDDPPGGDVYPVFTLDDDDAVVEIGFASEDEVKLSGGSSAKGFNGAGRAFVSTSYADSSSPRVYSIRFAEVLNPAGSDASATTVANAINGLLQRAGYMESEYSVDGLTDIDLYGYATAQVTSTRAHLETLRPHGLYECNCSDKIYIFPRATTPAGSIPWEDLGASESPGEPADPFPLQVGNEIEVPAQIAVRYRNVAANWNIGTEFSDRLISSREQSPQVVEIGFGMTPAQAKKVADTMLKDAVAGLGRATLRVGGRKHAKYEPGDVLTTTAPNGTAYRFRIITKRDYIFMLEWEVALDDASALDSPAITYEGYIDTSNPLRVAPTEWEVVDIPAVQDSDTAAPGPYVAVTPSRDDESDEWPGAVFVRARLPEAYEQVFISGDACVIGDCQTTLGSFDKGSTVLQREGRLRVRVRGELSGSTWGDFFTSRTINAAVVGVPGRWEPIRFMNATFVSTDGQYRIYDLSGFLRGQLGQEHLIGSHVSGERFVLLDNSIRRMVNEATDIDAEHQVKAVTLNLLLDSVVEEDFTDSGIVFKPYSPWNLRALPNGADIDVTWRRRSRLVGRYTTTGTFTPIGESTEAYRVKVYDDPNADPVRTVDVTTGAWTYAAADIATDGFSSSDLITITVQQLSESIGEGFSSTVEVTAP